MKKAQSQTCAREEVHGATQGIPSWAHRLGPQALGATRTCLWRSQDERGHSSPPKEMTRSGYLWRWHLFIIHFNYENTKISCRWHLFLIPFNYEHSQSVSQSVSRSRPALIRKYLVQLLISCHTIRQPAAPCREHVERVRLVRHRVFR